MERWFKRRENQANEPSERIDRAKAVSLEHARAQEPQSKLGAGNETKLEGVRAKARTEKSKGYPNRFPVPEDKAQWSVDYSEYQPPYHVDPIVLDQYDDKKEHGWADPEVFNPLKAVLNSFDGNIIFDKNGLPMNPHGRTGIAGRGLLGKWGPNHSADVILTKASADGKGIEVFLQQRPDGQWAFPGGPIDFGETAKASAPRELREETDAKIDLSDAREVYAGYVDDPRNTDNAWMETTVFRKHLTSGEAGTIRMDGKNIEGVKSGEVKKFGWFPVTPELLASLYASHGAILKKALES